MSLNPSFQFMLILSNYQILIHTQRTENRINRRVKRGPHHIYVMGLSVNKSSLVKVLKN